MKSNRRLFLRGLGGVTVSLPLLEGLRAGPANARDAIQADPYAIFLRQPCGVAAQQDTDEVGAEPERFWPREKGALTVDNVAGRALDELNAYLDRMLVLGNVNYAGFDFGDGHARGVLQALTSRPPAPGTYAGEAKGGGVSLDMFISQAVDGGNDSLFLHAGSANGWLGGPCVAWRDAAVPHAAIRDPYNAFTLLFGTDQPGDGDDTIRATRRTAINDLVRTQMQSLLAHPRLSSHDRSRLQDHFDAIRDLEVAVTCERDAAEEAAIAMGSAGYNDPTGDNLVTTVELHARVAALAVACGLRRSVVIQVGSGNGGELRFTDPDNGSLMENFHYISHRRLSHDSSGSIIAGSDVLHHKVDRHFARMFRTLLDALDAFEMPDGTSLLDAGVSAWFNDNSNGPQHCSWDTPWILAGSANGFFKQGQYVDVVERTGGGPRCSRSPDQAPTTIAQLHNTIATAAGVSASDGGPVVDFGDPGLPGGLLDRIMS